MKSKLVLLLHTFAFLSGTAVSETLFQLDFSTGGGTQAGWEAINGTGSPSGTYTGYTGLAGAGDITVSLANITFNRLYKNGFTGPADDFPDTDLDAMYSDLLFRNNDDETVDVSIGGLLAGTYQITTHHLNAPNTPSKFDLRVQDADSPNFGQFVGNFTMGQGNTSTFNPTVVTFEVVSNGTDDIILQMAATFIGTGGNTGGWFGINGLEIIPIPTNTFQLIITETSPPATGYDFQWNSQEGKVYDLLTSTDLATPTIEWTVYNDGEVLHEAIPSVGETTTLTAVPSADPRRFFAIREYDAPPTPPLLFADFESNNGGFTTTVDAGTAWEWGTPASTGPGGTVSSGNDGSANCWGTGIGNPGYYADPTTNSRLISPDIDLTSVTAAELSFAHAIDIPNDDTAVVRVFNADTGLEIVSGAFPLTVTDGNPANAPWADNGPHALPVGATIRIEWILSGTGGSDNDYMGWYVDDISVVEVSS